MQYKLKNKGISYLSCNAAFFLWRLQAIKMRLCTFKNSKMKFPLSVKHRQKGKCFGSFYTCWRRYSTCFSFIICRQHSSWTGGQPGPVGGDHWLPDSAAFIRARLPLLFPQTSSHSRRGAGNWVRVALLKPTDPFHVRNCSCNYASGRTEFSSLGPQFWVQCEATNGG